jgi:outer membrane protein, heavy metal efflux system
MLSQARVYGRLRRTRITKGQVQMILVGHVAAAAGVATIFLTGAIDLHAQVAPPQHLARVRHYEGPPVSLADLLKEAQEKNPELAVLRQQIQAVRQRPRQERGLNPPMADATIWQWPINSLNPMNTNMYMFMVEQEIPGRGKRALRAAVAEKDIALAENDVVVRARQIIGDIKQAYASLFVARKATDVHLATVELLRQIADVSQMKYATGRISQQDVLKPVVELSKLHTDIILLDEQADIATARLNTLVNRAPETPIGPLIEPREEALLPTTADLQRMAIARQPELERAQLEIERSEAALAAAKREYTPDFTLQGGYMLMPNMTDGWIGRVAITWPNARWARGKLDARVAELSAAVETTKARARAMENGIRLAVQEAFVRARSAQERAALLRTTIVPQSRQTLETSRVGYQTDRVDFQAVIDNERMLLDAQLDYIRALSDFAQARADLERAVGSELPDGTTTVVASDKDH